MILHVIVCLSVVWRAYSEQNVNVFDAHTSTKGAEVILRRQIRELQNLHEVESLSGSWERREVSIEAYSGLTKTRFHEEYEATDTPLLIAGAPSAGAFRTRVRKLSKRKTHDLSSILEVTLKHCSARKARDDIETQSCPLTGPIRVCRAGDNPLRGAHLRNVSETLQAFAKGTLTRTTGGPCVVEVPLRKYCDATLTNTTAFHKKTVAEEGGIFVVRHFADDYSQRLPGKASPIFEVRDSTPRLTFQREETHTPLKKSVDGLHQWITQISGSQRVRIVKNTGGAFQEASHRSRLRERVLFDSEEVFSKAPRARTANHPSLNEWLDTEDIEDNSEHSKHSPISVYSFEILPGDSVFIPSGYLLQTITTGNVSVSFNGYILSRHNFLASRSRFFESPSRGALSASVAMRHARYPQAVDIKEWETNPQDVPLDDFSNPLDKYHNGINVDVKFMTKFAEIAPYKQGSFVILGVDNGWKSDFAMAAFQQFSHYVYTLQIIWSHEEERERSWRNAVREGKKYEAQQKAEQKRKERNETEPQSDFKADQEEGVHIFEPKHEDYVDEGFNLEHPFFRRNDSHVRELYEYLFVAVYHSYSTFFQTQPVAPISTVGYPFLLIVRNGTGCIYEISEDLLPKLDGDYFNTTLFSSTCPHDTFQTMDPGSILLYEIRYFARSFVRFIMTTAKDTFVLSPAASLHWLAFLTCQVLIYTLFQSLCSCIRRAYCALARIWSPRRKEKRT